MPSSPQILLLASSNPGKLAELTDLLSGLPVHVLDPREAGFDLPDVVEDGVTHAANASKKALSATRAAATAGRADLWALAYDSGLAVDALGGAPGVRSARYAPDSVAAAHGDCTTTDQRNLEYLLEALVDVDEQHRQARFICALALAYGDRLLASVEGAVEGHILKAPLGSGGFGYDPVFFHPPSDATFGEVAPQAKAAVSHRSVAMRRLRDHLGLLFVARGRTA